MSDNQRRKILVVTGARSEYGLLLPLLQKLTVDTSFALQLIVTGSHLSPEFGHTVDEIVQSGIPIADEVEMLLSSDSASSTAKSMGIAMIGLADSFRRLQPDITLLIGDRYETLAAASVSLLSGVPIAHIHGGELTEGSLDDSMRHAITKMSHLHFVTTEVYRQRVIQLGEDPDSVYNTGAIGLDNIIDRDLISAEEIKKELGLLKGLPIFVLTIHSITTDTSVVPVLLQNLFHVLEYFQEYYLVFTKANADFQGRFINAAIKDFVDKGTHRYLFDSLGSLRYHSLIKAASAVIGNSSSGILEAPFLEIPSVNIGNRQARRILPESVIQTDLEPQNIQRAIRKADNMTDAQCSRKNNPYYNGGASAKIIEVLRAQSIITQRKSFFDIPVN